MSRRPCITCGVPTEGSRCQAHQLPARTHTRTTTQRGYGSEHQRARRALQRKLPAPCGYGCGTVLTDDSPWVAAHVVDGQPEMGWVAACPGCNERAKRRRGRAGLQPQPGADTHRP